MKKVLTSLLCLLVCGSIGLSAGCDLIDNIKEDSSVTVQTPPPAEEEIPVKQEDPAKVAFYRNVVASLYETVRYGISHEATLTASGTLYGKDVTYEEGTTTVLSAIPYRMEIEKVARLKYNLASAKVDGTYDGYTVKHTESGSQTSYEYGAAYLRVRNITDKENRAFDLYYGALKQETEIKYAHKALMKHEKKTLDKSVAEGSESLPNIDVMQLIGVVQKSLQTAIYTASGELTVTEDRQVLEVHIKAELENILASLERLARQITQDATLEEVLASKEMQRVYEQYLGKMTAAELASALNAAFLSSGISFPAPKEGASGYEYLTEILVARLGNVASGYAQKVGLAVEKLQSTIANIEELKLSMTLTGETFTGFTFLADIRGAIEDFSFTVTLAESENENYQDVTQLKLKTN